MTQVIKSGQDRGLLSFFYGPLSFELYSWLHNDRPPLNARIGMRIRVVEPDFMGSDRCTINKHVLQLPSSQLLLAPFTRPLRSSHTRKSPCRGIDQEICEQDR
jgi:hypothetical protein